MVVVVVVVVVVKVVADPNVRQNLSHLGHNLIKPGSF